jgi:hypothetical protein
MTIDELVTIAPIMIRNTAKVISRIRFISSRRAKICFSDLSLDRAALTDPVTAVDFAGTPADSYRYV